jgi:phosphoribosylformylglycinamidine synthase
MTTNTAALVLSGNGINCEEETAWACRCAGFERVDIVAIWKLMSGEVALDAYDFLVFPGGFLDGDEMGAAKAQVDRFLYMRAEDTKPYVARIVDFISRGKCILGICNGFQLLVKLGLLPALDNIYTVQNVTLTHNDRDKFEDRWVDLTVNPASSSLFLEGITRMYLPVRNGEGKLVVDDNEVLARIKSANHAALYYCDPVSGEPTMDYPANPSGAQAACAGLTDATGRVLGLMPHPEAYIDRLQHPRWSREQLPQEGDGLAIFKNACRYCRSLHV